MNKSKIIAICLVVVLALAGVMSGTLAYFTDTEVRTNVMVIGNFEVTQNEQQIARDPETGNPIVDGDGKPTFEDFQQNKPVVPAVIPSEDPNNPGQPVPTDPDTGLPETDNEIDFTPDDDTDPNVPIWDKNVNNEIDKFVTVTNSGDSKAYVRTIYAFEDNAATAEYPAGYVFKNVKCNWYNADNVSVTTEQVKKDDGTLYTIVVYTYPTALGAGKTTAPGLVQFYLDSSVDTEWRALTGEKYEIIVMSQIVQADGFADVTEAMTSSFGEVTAENVAQWFTDADDEFVAGTFTAVE